ncbi:MAG: SPFH domain-containing protein [Planctomycetota bacterium]
MTNAFDETQPLPPQRGLGDALKISFVVLRALFALLLVAFFLTGVFTVNQNEIAVRMSFGKITGAGAGEALTPGSGPYFRWPSPVGEVVRVPTTDRLLRIDRSFVFQARNPGAPLAEQEPVPGQQDANFGLLLTGDRNIIYARYDVLYRVRPDDSVIAFLTRAGPEDPAAVERMEGEARLNALFANADVIVRTAVEEAVVADASSRTIDAIRANRSAEGVTQTDTQDAIRAAAQQTLDELDVGIELTSVTRPEATVPPSVRAAFDALNAALQFSATSVSNGEAFRRTTMTTTAGDAAEGLLLAIEAYDFADAAENEELLAAAEEAIERILGGEEVGLVLTTLAASVEDELLSQRLEAESVANASAVISGTAFEAVRRARTEASTLRRQAESLEERTMKLLPAFRDDPNRVRARLVLSTLRDILGRDEATVEYLPETERLVIQVPADPERARDAERRRLGISGE